MTHFKQNYENNIQALKNIDIVLATKVIQSGLGQSFELSTISEEHQLFNILDHMHERALYSNIVDELQEQIRKLKSQVTLPFVYLFGIGNGYTLPILLHNQTHKRITVFEVELELLFVTFHIYDLSEAILSRRLRFFSNKSFSFAQAVHLFKEHQAYHHAKNFDLMATADYYANYFSQEYNSLNELLTEAFSYHLNLIRSLDTQLHFLLCQHNNLSFQLLQSRLESFENIKNATALIINQELNNDHITAIKSMQENLTVICSNTKIAQLLDAKITPDIVVTYNNEPKLWEGVSLQTQSQIIEVFVNYNDELSDLQTATQKFICHYPIEFYFETQTDQKVHFHDNALSLALEASYLLGHTQTLIMDKDFRGNTTLGFQNLAYITSFYKDKMRTVLISDEKLEPLEALFKPFKSVISSLKKEQLLKQHVEFDAFDEDIVESKKFRQELKLKHLLTISLTFLETLEQSIHAIQPWYEALDGLDEEALLSFYSDTELASHIHQIGTIREAVEQDSSFQKFYHDFLHPTMLLSYIEMATIQTLNALTASEIRSKHLQWAIINYQWLNQLHYSVSQTMELLKNQLEN